MENKIIIILLITLNLILIRHINFFSNLYNIFDIPNKRKKHNKPVALLGGPILFLFINCILLNLMINSNQFFKYFLITKLETVFLLSSCSLIFFIGYFDDKKGLSANFKLATITITILLFLFVDKNSNINFLNFDFTNYIIHLGSFSIAFTLICFLLFMNAFNMFDGIDLQASLYSIWILIILYFKSDYSIFILLFLIQVIFISYLNFEKKIFLGDGGSLLLSFLLSVIIVKFYNSQYYTFKADEIFLIMMLPGIDLLRLAIYRIVKKRHPFAADNEHLHHYLINKYGFFKTTMIIQSLLTIPLIFYYIGGYILISIFSLLFIYLVLIINFKYEKK